MSQFIMQDITSKITSKMNKENTDPIKKITNNLKNLTTKKTNNNNDDNMIKIVDDFEFSSNELDKDEPILQENPNRYVLFPIQNQAVSIFLYFLYYFLHKKNQKKKKKN